MVVIWCEICIKGRYDLCSQILTLISLPQSNLFDLLVFFFILPKLLLGCIYIAAACLHIDGEMAACYIIMFYCIYQHQQIRKNISLAPGSSALEMLLSQLNLNEALAVQLL